MYKTRFTLSHHKRFGNLSGVLYASLNLDSSLIYFENYLAAIRKEQPKPSDRSLERCEAWRDERTYFGSLIYRGRRGQQARRACALQRRFLSFLLPLVRHLLVLWPRVLQELLYTHLLA